MPGHSPHRLDSHQNLSSLSKLLIKANQGKAIPDAIAILDPLHRLLAAGGADVDGLDPALEVLLGRQLQHGLHLLPVSNMVCADVTAAGDKVLEIELNGVIGHSFF
jgi:hypothetical protein